MIKDYKMRLIKTTLCISVLLALSACGEKETVESHLNNAKTQISANKINKLPFLIFLF